MAYKGTPVLQNVIQRARILLFLVLKLFCGAVMTAPIKSNSQPCPLGTAILLALCQGSPWSDSLLQPHLSIVPDDALLRLQAHLTNQNVALHL